MRSAWSFTTIAETGDRFSDFAPYVASVNAAGTVAFQAQLRGGRTGVFTGVGGPVSAGASGGVERFTSHPDITSSGALSVYAELAGGGEAVVLLEHGRPTPLAGAELARVGPLGPTMNDAGTVAFRADSKAGRSGVFTVQRGSVRTIADTGRFAGFQGLPVVEAGGTVVFRADLQGGGQGIYLWRGSVEAVVETGDRFRELGFFPSVNDRGVVAFAAVLCAGGSGVFTSSGGEVTTVVESGAAFESFRGALIDDEGRVVFYGTPRGGALGIYAGEDRLLGIGDPFLDSTVAELALNPVSINGKGQLAIRLRLASGQQLVVRVDRS